MQASLAAISLEFGFTENRLLVNMVLPVVGRPLTQVALSEGRRNWPFVFGFAFTLGLVIKLSTSLNRTSIVSFLLLLVLLLYPLSPFFSFQTLDLFGVLSARGGDFGVTVTIESMLLKNGSSSIRVWGPFWLLSAHTTCSSSGSHLLTCYLGLELVCLGTVRRGHRFEMIRFTVMSRLLAGFAHEDWMFALFTVDCVKALFYVFSFCLHASHLLLSNFVALSFKSWSWTYPNSLPKLGLKVDFEAASK